MTPERSIHQLKYHGVHPIVPTAFHDDGSLDLNSQRRLVDHLIAIGVQGIAILGFLGEAHKLTDAERRAVIEAVADQARGRLKLLVGVRATGTAGAIEQAITARELGADAVFVAPLPVPDSNALFRYFSDVAGAAGVDVMIHDYPAAFGTQMPADLIIRLANEVTGIAGIKLEEPPVLVKASRVLDGAPQLAVLGGLGGVFFLEELDRGACGIMTGFSFPDVLLDIYNRYVNGDRDAAARVFDRYMPLMRYEFQPQIGLAFRKHVFQQKGLFSSTFVRTPGMQLDSRSAAEFDAIVERVGLSYRS